MRCYIAHMLYGEAEKIYEEVIRDISTTFSKDRLYENLRRPHITLKTPFEIDSIETIEEIVSSFCASKSSSKFTLDGFGHFDKEVIYLHVNPSNEMRENIKLFLKELRKINGILCREVDNENKLLHVTLLKYNEIGNNFNDIFDYLSKRETFVESSFNNIAIIKFGTVYKKYTFKD